MICLIALVAFGVLGIFSAKYRALAKEAFNCVFRRVTLRKCDTGFDTKMKSRITGRLIAHPRVARFVYRNFEGISWALTIAMIASLALSAQGVYNYLTYGNCNGQQGGFCIFSAASGGAQGFSLSDIPLAGFPSIGPENARVSVVEFGCFQCPYTRAAEPVVDGILAKHAADVRLTFVYAPVPSHRNGIAAAEAAACAARQGMFRKYGGALFQDQASFGNSVGPADALAVFKSLAGKVGLNVAEFNACVDSGATKAEVQQSADYAMRMGITGTPTFYVNGKKVSGVVSEADVEKALSG